jgi:hypothetical protein
MSLATTVSASAARALKSYGAAAVLTRRAPGVYSSSTGAPAIGTITTGLVSKAATVVAVGVSSLTATTAAGTGACALKTGDFITFAGDTQVYTLTANATQAAAASDVTLSFTPGLKVAHVGGEAVSVQATNTSSTRALLEGASPVALGFKFGPDLVQTGDLLATIANDRLEFSPVPGDTLTVDSVVYQIIGTRPLYVGASAVMWDLLVRK